MLLVPADLDRYLTPAQLEAVLAHEWCHARRPDNLTAAIHMAGSTR
jgi:beta-lactamase regulating signal transducer with metallopeptidase domain